jgi:hypothetical protein
MAEKPKNARTRMVLIRHMEVLLGKEVRRPDPTAYDLISDSLKEVAETLILEWTPAISVTSPCFIFHIDTIQKGLVPCKGMERLYFIRFQKSSNGKLLPISENNWEPFYRDLNFPDIESYPESIWNSLICLKQEVQKSMCRGGQWNGRTTSAKLVGAHSSFFRYLKDEMESLLLDEVKPHLIRYTRSRKIICDNLSACREKIKYNAKLIRILDEEELDAVRKIFGLSFGVGVMQSVPSVKALKANPLLRKTVLLRNTDPVRIVTCLPQVDDLEVEKNRIAFRPVRKSGEKTDGRKRVMKLLCSFRGLDFRYTSPRFGVPELSVQCRFVKVRGDSCVLKKLLLCDMGSNDSQCDSDSSELVLCQGDYIKLEGPTRVYVVREVSAAEGTVRCVSPSHNPVNEPIVLTMEEAKEGYRRACE